MTKKLLFVISLLLVVALSAMAADVSGKWIYEQQGRGGGDPTKVTLTLKASGASLTGSVAQPGRDGNVMEQAISEGKVDGSTITFKVSREGQNGPQVTSYKGTVNGDTIDLEVTRTRNGEPMTTKVQAKKATT